MFTLNVFLGRELSKLPEVVKHKKMQKRASQSRESGSRTEKDYFLRISLLLLTV